MVSSSSYASTEDWDGLSRVLTTLTRRPLLDQMTLLKYTGRPRNPGHKPDFTNSDHVYWRMQDIAADLTCSLVPPSPRFAGGEELIKLWSSCRKASRKMRWGIRSNQLLGAHGYILLYLKGALDFVSQALEKYAPAQHDDIEVEKLMSASSLPLVELLSTLSVLQA